jgi:hypothetical protein
MVIHKPQKSKIDIPRICVPGIITSIEKGKSFIVKRRYKSRESKELKEIEPKIQKIENGKFRYFKPTIVNCYVNMYYLNLESAKGLFKDPNNNLPYEIISQYGEWVYIQNTVERKEDIFNRLEKLAIDEGLRK